MAEPPGDQPLVINTQYIKDLSFEVPDGPAVFAALSQRPPEVSVNVDVRATHVRERSYEVVLSFRIQATTSEHTAFLVELDYAGLATLGGAVAQAEIEPLLLSETPRYLFPFARGALATVTRDGGFPPLVINPIDFEQFYRRHKVGTLARGGSDGPRDAEASGA